MRTGGFGVLFGAACLISSAVGLLDVPPGPGRVMFVVAGVAILSSVAWYAWRRD
ncbi:hypothetical protein GCM10020358_23900 [Amorphoplanes nipponensis]|uniref:Uncharacterized protein n=1 Tax=Actinoplanes nipponensis TaxID=135950 RepID=A0A919JL02_9ACTN|nr:hypothetical protein [Actinoplanes nipponensis]GIE51072.1 hypothetical protein Ani05nite_46060 [Actinoplanes nipponensis]